VNEIVDWLLASVNDIDPWLRTAIAGFGMLLETSLLVGLVVPGDTIVIITSTAVTGWIDYLALVGAVVLGALAGESIGFALGHYFGPKIRASRLGRRIGEAAWSRAESYLDRRGGIAVFISRFLPVLHSLIPVTVGMGAMRYRTFMAWTVPACIIWSFAYISVGALAAGSYRQLSGQLHAAGYVFVGIIGAFLLTVVVVKKLLLRSQARHMKSTETELE
jgi:membrane protein DedA with SNARE-associated domain